MRAALTALAVLLVPLLELAAFRLWLRFGLDLRLGLPGFVDFDLLLPSVIAFFALGIALHKERPIEPELQAPNLKLHLYAAFLFGAASYFFHSIEAWLGLNGAYSLWLGALVIMVFSAFFIFIPLRYWLHHPRKWLIIPCLLASISVVLVKHLYPATWPWFGAGSAQATCDILQLLDPSSTCEWGNAYYLTIRYQDIHVRFGPPCSGTDGLVLFIVGFCTYLALDGKRAFRPSALFLFGVGVGYALLLNTFRVVAIFLLSQMAGNYFQNGKVGTQVLVAFFHMHAGWVLYAIGWTFFFAVVAVLETLPASLHRRSSVRAFHRR